MEPISGRVHVVGDHINTDLIIPGRWCALRFDAESLGPHALDGVEPDWAQRVLPGDILVAGQNFGCGSSREHAVVAIQGAGIAAVVAQSFARIFFRNAINRGLPVITCPPAVALAHDGSRCRIDLAGGTVEIDGQIFTIAPYPPYIQAILDGGGLMNLVAARVRERQAGMR